MATLASLALACALVPAVAVTAFAAEVEDAGAAVLRALSSDEVVASGTSGTVTWTLYGDGELVLAPTSGDTGTMESLDSYGDTPWYEYRDDIISVTITGTVVCGSSAAYMFAGSSLTSLDLEGLDTSNVTSMSHMFNGCSSLVTLDLSGLDTSSVTDMSCMFWNCFSLESVDLSGLDTSNVTSMGWMFTDCISLQSVDLSGLDTSNVTDMEWMFADCISLQSVGFSGLETSSMLSNTWEMFCSCSSLETLDLSGFDTSSVSFMAGMFAGCTSLTTVYVSELWSTESVISDDEYGGYVFTDCTSLVGGNGTAYSSDHDDYTYARIDTASTPGYFTYKAYEGESTSNSGTSIAKKAQSIKVKAKKATTVKYKKLKKKAQSVKASKLCKATGAKGTLTYSKVSVKHNGKKASSKVAKKITVSKAGKVTLKKGLAKGTYKVKLKVKAKATSNYKASKAKTVTVTIKVK